MTFREALNWGKEKLQHAGIPEYDLDAWLLLEHVSGLSRAMYFVRDREEMEESCREQYEEAIRKRESRVPLQHITGVQEFMGYEFHVNEHVLIPRQDTEILVEEADRAADDTGAKRILDVCTGSGCILLSLLKMNENRTGTGSDLSEPALKMAEENRRLLEIPEERAAFVQSDLFERIEGTYDMIVSNPPYIRTEEIRKLQEEVRLHDPYGALDGKEDGLYFYRKIISQSPSYLEDGGYLIFEIGHDQACDVTGMMRAQGFSDVSVKKDLAGLDRVVYGRYIR